MGDKDSIKEFYKTKCEVPDEGIPVAVTSCNRKAIKQPKFIREALALVHDDVISRSYGCSTAYPEVLEGTKILDLGSGSGRDCFVLSHLVGQDGSVVGVDMTDEALDLAKSKIEYHQQKYGYSSPNISFVKGYMERLDELGLEENYFDIIVSNCVISLCKDKKAVLKEAIRVLKPHGELFFSDIYRDGELPADVMDDTRLWCEGITGSMIYQQLHAISSELGFARPRLVGASELPILDQSVKDKIGNVKHAAVTYRLFKKSNSAPETTSGTKLMYKGGIRGYEDLFTFDHRLQFKKDEWVILDEETPAILTQSRYGKFFESTDDSKLGPENQSLRYDYEVVDPFSLVCVKSA